MEASIDSLFQIARREYDLPGVVVITFENGEIDQGYAFGRRNDTDSMTVDAVFEAASLSKTILTYIAHSMARKGILDLDRPVSENFVVDSVAPSSLPKNLYWLLGGTNVKTRHKTSAITPRTLLNHTAGFAGIDEMGNPVLKGSPGERFRYAENGYLLLQRLLEQSAGENLEAMASTKIFSPLCMQRSSFIWQSNFLENEVAGFGYEGEIDRYLKRPEFPLANGTLLTCATDYGKFIEALFADRIMVDSLLAEAVPVDPNFPELQWGNGVGLETVDEKIFLWQWGSNWVYRSYFAIDAEKGNGFLVFTNNIRGYKFFAPLSKLVIGKPLVGISWAKWNG